MTVIQKGPLVIGREDVDISETLRDVHEREVVSLRLDEDSLPYASILPVGASSIELRGTDPAQRAEVREALDSVVGQWDIDSLGNGDWRITLPPNMRAFIETNAVKQTLNILRNRIDEFGVADPIITEQGMTGDRILVQLPGVQNPERMGTAVKSTFQT